ncbi:MAG: hypothetical protein ACHP65_06455 [Legionellales bacterium]
MTIKPQKIIENVIPFMVAGCFIALVVGMLIVFSYVLVWGLIIGFVLWTVSIIKKKLAFKEPDKKKGRIIEHEDKK